MRALAFGPDHRALANVAVKVTLTDDEGQTQFEDTFNTSKFGVARADWEIPQKLQLGDISITAGVSRYSHGRMEREGLQLGFAAVDSKEIRRGVRELAIALESVLKTLHRGGNPASEIGCSTRARK